jgi:predicted DNA-binding protein (UPF0251 family)
MARRRTPRPRKEPKVLRVLLNQEAIETIRLSDFLELFLNQVTGRVMLLTHFNHFRDFLAADF